MKRLEFVGACAAALLLVLGLPAFAGAGSFNAVDNEIDQYGYYYAVSGGLFPTGNTPNGATGTIAYITDDTYWESAYGIPGGTWFNDTWYPANSSMALTLKNGSSIVYDNNGLETPGVTATADFYNYNKGGAGAVVGYSMSNNYDWIYAGYFQITQPTTVTSLTGFFISPGPGGVPWDPSTPGIQYRMNIWSNVNAGPDGILPSNTGSFAGDVFSSDTTPGNFTWSDTGYQRVGSSSSSDIYGLVDTLNSPMTLQPGTYWFSSDATVPTPEPISMIFFGTGLIAVGGYMARRRMLRTA